LARRIAPRWRPPLLSLSCESQKRTHEGSSASATEVGEPVSKLAQRAT